MKVEQIETAVEEIHPQVIAWRRHLHAHPELSFEEVETSAYVVEQLQAMEGIEVTRPTKTSVVGRLKGLAGSGKTIAMRADMDALPIQEDVDEPYRSKNDGVMHACGHDGHTSMLLGVAKVLSDARGNLVGEYVFLFQHAEEVPPGGAIEMVRAGVLDGVDHVLGMHLWSIEKLGKMQLTVGPMSASSDIFDVKIIGKSGHASAPDDAIDALAIAAQIVSNLQMVVSRSLSPLQSGVLSITRFRSGEAYNVIPQEAIFGGSVRALTEEVRETIKTKIEQISDMVAKAHGATIEFHYEYGYDPVYNDETLMPIVDKTLRQFEDLEVEYIEPMLGGEDFSAFSNVVPSCYIGVGALKEREGKHYPHHHPKFEIHEDAFKNGMRYFLSVATTLAQQ